MEWEPGTVIFRSSLVYFTMQPELGTTRIDEGIANTNRKFSAVESQKRLTHSHSPRWSRLWELPESSLRKLCELGDLDFRAIFCFVISL